MTAIKGQIIDRKSYTRLLKQLRTLLETGQERARAAAAREMVQTYWKMGELLDAQELAPGAGYGSAILAELAADLGLEPRTLQRARLFHRTYPEHPPGGPLTWTHYRKLLTIGDRVEREYYEQLAIDSQLSSYQLEAAIRADVFDHQPLQPTRARREIPRPAHDYYVFKARIERVIDGDTVEALLDTGFHIYSKQRIRLVGVNAPESNTLAGEKATRFVRDQLATATFVVIQTTGRDVHNRYVGHLYYQPDETDWRVVHQTGRHLNAELLRRGLAR